MGDYLHKIVEKAVKNKKSFEQIANELGLEQPEKMDIEQKRTRNIVMRWAAVAVSVLLLTTAIVLGVVLPISPQPPQNGLPPTFSAYDSVAQNVSLDYLYSVDGLLLFNKEQILNADDGVDAFRHVVNDLLEGYAGKLLSYTAHQIILLSLDEQNAFLIDYMVRIYRYYVFFAYIAFEPLEQYFVVNNIKVYYQIFYNNRALVRFTHNNLDYFLTIACFFEQDITTQTLIDLLNELIIA